LPADSEHQTDRHPADHAGPLEGEATVGTSKAVTDASFATDVLQSDKPVLVDFWAEWCGPCRKVSPLLEEIAAEMAGKVRIVKVNIDENPEVTRTYRIMSVPTLTIFRGGQPVKSASGARPKSDLIRLIESAL
jgi:thioredoxin 1